ncbi:MAG: N-6 DNA methylase [Myxococcota bacterium]|jgi:hypothetical protein|nr:N-6 DNA methylase [Myxococcota bacterium]
MANSNECSDAILAAWACCEQAGLHQCAQEGAVFTPPRVARALALAGLSRIPAESTQLSVLDPAAGAGALLLATLEYLLRIRQPLRSLPASLRPLQSRLASLRQLELCAFDLDPRRLDACRAALSTLLPAASASGLELCLTCRLANGLEEPWPEIALVVCNPPYLRASRRGNALRNAFSTTTGSFDLFVPFIERAVRALPAQGLAAFLVPTKLFSADYASALRALLCREAPPLLLMDLTADRSFGEQVDVALCLFRKERGTRNEERGTTQERGITQERGAGEGLQGCVLAQTLEPVEALEQAIPPLLETVAPVLSSSVSARRVGIRELAASPRWWVDGSERAAALLAQLEQQPPALLPWRTGIMGFDYHETLACVQEAQAQASLPWEPAPLALMTPGLLRPFASLWGQKPLRLGGTRWLRPVLARRPASLSDATWAWFQQPKVLVSGVCRELGGYADLKGRCAPLVAVHGVALDAERILVLSALLSSRLLNWWWRRRFASARIPRGSFRVSVSMLEALPVAPQLWSSPLAELARALHKKPDPGLRQQLDQLVFDAYGVDERDRTWILEG